VTVVVWIFALLAAASHIVVFTLEAFLIERPSVHRGVFGLPYVPAVRVWAFGVGFYNLFLACGMVVGVIAWMSGNETVGRTLVIYICLFMVLGGIVLSSPTGWGLVANVARASSEHLARVCHHSSPFSLR
jgi:putative membrane protein